MQRAQQSNFNMDEFMEAVNFYALEQANSFSVFRGEEVLLCGGVFDYWPGRAEVWSFLSVDAGKHFVALTRVVRRFLNMCTQRRIEAVVDCNFEQGHRWVRMLGFKLEAPRMKAYHPQGEDCALYARVR